MTTLFTPPLSLMVSLPRNDPALAEAAASAGADALKVHINVEHRASGNVFGSLADERHALEGVLAAGLPTGLVVGGAGRVHREEMRQAAELGFAFFDVYLHHAPAWYPVASGGRPAVVALSCDDPLDRARGLAALGVAAVEASLAPPQDYGTPLTLQRVADYRRLRDLAGLPVIVPTQHAISPADIPALAASGVDALLIGAVVTGDQPEDLAAATKAFRDAIDTLPTQ